MTHTEELQGFKCVSHQTIPLSQVCEISALAKCYNCEIVLHLGATRGEPIIQSRLLSTEVYSLYKPLVLYKVSLKATSTVCDELHDMSVHGQAAVHMHIQDVQY